MLDLEPVELDRTILMALGLGLAGSIRRLDGSLVRKGRGLTGFPSSTADVSMEMSSAAALFAPSASSEELSRSMSRSSAANESTERSSSSRSLSVLLL